MEKLSIEEKAKAYDEALERARMLIEKLESNHIKGFIYHIFPELKENNNNIDWEHRYNDTLSRARKYYEHPLRDDSDRIVEWVFPELKEHDDDKNIKELISELRLALRAAECQNDSCGGGHKKRIALLKWAITWLEKQKEPEDKGEISDGYHTFNELYRYRMLYNAAFFNLLPKEWVHKSKKHHDGEECFGGEWFIVMANLPTGQISNHYELKDWDLFQIPEKDVADEWDGHTPQDAADRLNKYLLEKQKEQKDIIIHEADNCIFESVFTDSLGKPADNAALIRKIEWLSKVGEHNIDGIMKYLKNNKK